MPRTTAESVAFIIELDEDIDLTSFILTANELVTEVCVPLGYSDTRLELIERWLSAHFYAIRDMRVSQEQAGPVSASYQHKVGLMLANTMYGQQAMLLDTQGGLASLSKSLEMGRKKPTMFWLGKKLTRTEYGE